jgi:hypothetical protein
MRLMTAHKILIGAAIVFFVYFAVVQWRGIGTGQGSLTSALMGAACAIGLGVYFRTLRGK